MVIFLIAIVAGVIHIMSMLSSVLFAVLYHWFDKKDLKLILTFSGALIITALLPTSLNFVLKYVSADFLKTMGVNTPTNIIKIIVFSTLMIFFITRKKISRTISNIPFIKRGLFLLFVLSFIFAITDNSICWGDINFKTYNEELPQKISETLDIANTWIHNDVDFHSILKLIKIVYNLILSIPYLTFFSPILLLPLCSIKNGKKLSRVLIALLIINSLTILNLEETTDSVIHIRARLFFFLSLTPAQLLLAKKLDKKILIPTIFACALLQLLFIYSNAQKINIFQETEFVKKYVSDKIVAAEPQETQIFLTRGVKGINYGENEIADFINENPKLYFHYNLNNKEKKAFEDLMQNFTKENLEKLKNVTKAEFLLLRKGLIEKEKIKQITKELVHENSNYILAKL